MTAKILPRNLTSYDLLKTLAIILMVLDHVGYFFFPQELWFRLLGRLCVPIWFFLIGYAETRTLAMPMWIGGFTLMGMAILCGGIVFPLDILLAMLVIRMVLDPVMKLSLVHIAVMMMVLVGLALLIPLSYSFFAYGTLGLILAMVGYVARNRPQIRGLRDDGVLLNGMTLFAVPVFLFTQNGVFAFDLIQQIVMAAGTVGVFILLHRFRPAVFPESSFDLSPWQERMLRFIGRHTLGIYVANLILFNLLGVLTQPDRFRFLQPTWIWLWG